MKKMFKVLLATALISSGLFTNNETKAQTSVSFSVFYNSLRPYGRWMNNSSYGQVWVSNTPNFTPYSTGGHWAYTDYGWTWVSDYDWGWAPFHYGRWSYNRSYGWYWVPGYEWSPAWVSWRNNDEYYGWAPLNPGADVSIGISFGGRGYGRWNFAPRQYITSPYISRYYVPRTRNITVIKNTTIVNNVTVKNNVRYQAGPRREDVERATHTKVQTYTIANSNRPGRTVINKNTVNVYRPVINNNDKTVINNSNNKTTINKNSNNATVNNNSNNKTAVNKNSNNDNNNKTAVTKNNNNNKTGNSNNANKNNNNSNNNNSGNNNNNNSQLNNAKSKKPAPEKTKFDKQYRDNMRPPQKKQQQKPAQKPNQNNKPPKHNQ